VNECGVASSIGSFDFDVGFHYVSGGCGRGCCSGKARAHGERYKVAAGDIGGWLVFWIFGHGVLLKNCIAFGLS
jgi:hypothetical protein